MLDYKILELNHSVSYGSVTLKSLQNDYVPELDLLVREAIQNSSDASLEEAGDSFKVNFTTGYFCPFQQVNSRFIAPSKSIPTSIPASVTSERQEKIAGIDKTV